MSHGTTGTSDAVGVPDRANGDRPVSERGDRNGDISERMWAYDLTGSGESPAADDLAHDLTAGPTRQRSIRKALRRRWWLWCTTAVLGLMVGLGLFAEKPPGYQASASVMLAYSSDQNVANASVTDLSLAQSHSVAEATLQRLGLTESLASSSGRTRSQPPPTGSFSSRSPRHRAMWRWPGRMLWRRSSSSSGPPSWRTSSGSCPLR